MGADLNQFVLATDPTDAALARRAAVHIADHVAAKHPHALDELMPRLAGRLLAKDPEVRGEVADLLDAIGLAPAQGRAS